MPTPKREALDELGKFLGKLLKFWQTDKDANLRWPSYESLLHFNTLILSVYGEKRKNAPPRFWKAVEGVDADYPKLRLSERIRKFVRRATSIPKRPVAFVMGYIKAINPSFSFLETSLMPNDPAVNRHGSLLAKNETYRGLFTLLGALSESDSEIIIPESDLQSFLPHLEKIALQFSGSKLLLQKWQRLHPGNTGGHEAARMKAQLLFSETHRRELAWRLRYFDQFNAMAVWVESLREPTLDVEIEAFGTVGQEDVESGLRRRKQALGRARVQRHRQKSRS